MFAEPMYFSLSSGKIIFLVQYLKIFRVRLVVNSNSNASNFAILKKALRYSCFIQKLNYQLLSSSAASRFLKIKNASS